MSINKSCLFSGILLTTTAISTTFLLSPSSFADDTVVDNISVLVPTSCTLSGIGTDSHVATINNATYTEDVGKTTLTAFCNDNGGFAIYAIGFTGDAYSGEDHTKLIGTNTNQKIATGTATGTNNNDPSNWAMKLTKVENISGQEPTAYNPANLTILNGYDSYSSVPDTYAKVASFSSATDTTLGSKLETTYAVFIDRGQHADTYVGKVKYTLVHPASEVPLQPQTTQAGKICYYPNGSGVLGSMGCQTISSSDTSATLLASNLSREGYGFAGWSTTFDYSDSNGFYGPQEYITFTAGTYTGQNNGLSLYAHWIESAGSLQDWSGCSTLQAGAVTALTDQRDNETYAVAKLADGNCWMIKNIRLENTATDNLSGALAQGYETGFTGLANPEGPWDTSSSYTTANSLYSIDGSTANTISGSNPAHRFPRYNNVNTPANPTNVSDRPSNPTTNDATNSTSNAGLYSYGNYYTWAAAAANTTVTSTGDYNTKSICPKSWSLPRGGNKSREATNDFWNLVVTHLNNGTNPANYESSTYPYYNGSAEAGPVANTLRAYPNNFVYSGYIDSGSVNYRGSYGWYWSSTANGSLIGYNLYLFSTYVRPGTYSSSKYYGGSVRCIVSGV